MAKADTQKSIAQDGEAIARALGSATPQEAPLIGPLAPSGLLVLAQRFNRRLRSTGGRRTDPDWTLSRRIPLKASTWESLQRIADVLVAQGQNVAPGQVAAVLLEDQITQLEELDKAAMKARRTSRAPASSRPISRGARR
jgi:Fe-S-cluster formation regulator IscX/YfhJ